MFWCPTKSTFQNVSHGLFLLPINGIYPFLFKSLCEKIYPLGESGNYRIEPNLKKHNACTDFSLAFVKVKNKNHWQEGHHKNAELCFIYLLWLQIHDLYSIEFQKYMILFLHLFSVVERVDWRSKVESGQMITIVSYLTVIFNFNDTVYICDICK